VIVRRRAVFLDRDGVINRAHEVDGIPRPPDSELELEILPGVPEALLLLRRLGFTLIVVTNQPDVARGAQDRRVVEAMHARLLAELPLDEIRVCYHDDVDDCGCRKPRPGMLIEASRERGIDLAASFLVGDRWRDVAAGQGAGCRTILVDHGYAEGQRAAPDVRVGSLEEAAAWIANNCRGNDLDS
jgi:D-glycero-D-manno-heptose 1,7-bisphosphate phosphatase